MLPLILMVGILEVIIMIIGPLKQFNNKDLILVKWNPNLRQHIRPMVCIQTAIGMLNNKRGNKCRMKMCIRDRYWIEQGKE